MLKKCLRQLGIIAAVSSLVACQADNKLDLESLQVAKVNKFNASSFGYVITEQENPLAIPEIFHDFHQLASSLIDQHWLANPKFIEQANSLKILFQSTELSEAQVFIDALDETTSQYASNIAKVNAIAQAKQLKINEQVAYYSENIDQLERQIRILKTPQDEYEQKITALSDAIQTERKRFTKLRNAFQSAFRELDSDDHPMAYDIRFSYIQQPRAMCSRFDEMRELITPFSDGCAYVNREELLQEIPAAYHSQAEKLIDHYAPQLWSSLIKLSGFFDTTYNTQFFPNNLRELYTKAKLELREKQSLSEQATIHSIEDYEFRLAKLKEQRLRQLPYGLIDENLRINTASRSFINYFERFAKQNEYSIYEPTIHFKQLIDDEVAVKNFTLAYAKQALSNYPMSLKFRVSGRGYYNIPEQDKAQGLVFDFTHSHRHLLLDGNQRGLPRIINCETPNIHNVDGVSLVEEIDRRLQAYILS